MSTLEHPTTIAAPRAPAALRAPAWRHTALAGGVLVAAAAAGEAGADGLLTLVGAGVGTVLAAVTLAPSVSRAARAAGLGLALATVGLGGLLVLGWFASSGSALASPYWLVVDYGVVLVLGVALVGAAGGFVLLADGLRVRLRRPGTGWRRLTAPTTGAAPEVPWGLLAGAALVLSGGLAALWVLGGFLGGGALVLLVLLGVGALALATPLVVGGLARADRTMVERSFEDERLRIAAHLHDSVLQTLALVQRQADDPQAVARLARRQEHELRAWMAGDAELGADTLVGALRDAVAEVEEERGLAVEVSLIGDRPIDPGGEALVAALREALRNAARHAPVSPVYVFAEVTPDRVEAFVRDEGPGFVLGAVPRERRGVRDAIVGRMAAVGGSASVESVVGEGTEVVLRIGVPR